MSNGDFEAIGNSHDRMFGPRAFIASGFSAPEQKTFLAALRDAGIQDVPVCFASGNDASAPLGSLAARAETTGLGTDSDLARAVVLSGATEAELHAVMGAYRGHGLPRPLWATLTEMSTDWPLGELLAELAAERAAIEGQGA